jgi:hypothetical protein
MSAALNATTFKSTVATGTAPFVVASATLVSTLYTSRAALADTVTTNATLTGPITSSGNATAIASQTGTGTTFVVNTSPTLVTPVLGVASATSLNSTTYINAFDVCNGRLTLMSGAAVPTTDVTGAGTLYFTPYKGSYIALYSGSQWQTYLFSEVSITLALLVSGVYDVFANASGALVVLSLLAWTTTTARATALVLQNGVYSLTGTLTKRYLGTIYLNNTASANDAATLRYVWNYYNRVPRVCAFYAPASGSGAQWQYSSATIRAANGDSTYRLAFVQGLAEDSFGATINIVCNSGAVCFGINSTTTQQGGNQLTPYVTGAVQGMSAFFSGIVNIVGLIFVQWNEYSAAGTAVFYYGGAPNTYQSGIIGIVQA